MTYPLTALQTRSSWIPKIIVSDHSSIHVIPIDSIIFMEAQGSYSRIVTKDIDILSSRPLGDYEGQLNQLPFFRCHHSYLVNLNCMVRYDKVCRYIELDNGDKVSVSFRKKDGLMQLLQDSSTSVPLS